MTKYFKGQRVVKNGSEHIMIIEDVKIGSSITTAAQSPHAVTHKDQDRYLCSFIEDGEMKRIEFPESVLKKVK